MTDRPAEAEEGTILIVCTGNVCRSPYIQMLLSNQLVGRQISVTSAGTGALVGSAIELRVAQHLVDIGLDPNGFVSRQVTPEVAADVDLILCATREHRSYVARMDPKLLRRTYALADFSDMCTRLIETRYRDGGRHADSSESLVARIADAATRARAEVRVRSAEEAQIVDPFRRPERILDEMISQVDRLLPPIVSVLAGSADTSTV